jgi:hypothetical protein
MSDGLTPIGIPSLRSGMCLVLFEGEWCVKNKEFVCYRWQQIKKEQISSLAKKKNGLPRIVHIRMQLLHCPDRVISYRSLPHLALKLSTQEHRNL